MKHLPESPVQVLVEPGLPSQQQPHGRRPRSGSGRSKNFQAFRFTRKGTGGSLVLESKEESAGPHSSQVTVFHFAPKSGGLPAARKLVKYYSSTHQLLIAIASPEVYNRPDYRSLLLDHKVEVLVQEEDQFELQSLAPWIARIVKPDARGKRTSPKKSSATVSAAAAPSDLIRSLRDPDSGRLDARKIATLLGISLTDLATKVCGVTKQNLSQSPTSAGIQDKLADLEEIAGLLSWCGSEAKLKAWLKRPNRDFAPLNGKILSPVDLILMGRARSVANKVHHMLLGHPS